MKLKYYLRGLGIGIICTALIMGFAASGKGKEKLTDAEVIERARNLGMIMADEAEEKNTDFKEEDIKEPKKENGKETDTEEPKKEDEKETDTEKPKEDSQKEEDKETDSESKSDSKAEDSSKSEAKEPKEDAKSDAENEGDSKADSKNSKEDGKDRPDSEKPGEEVQDSEETRRVEILPGEHSHKISQKLFDAGLIEDVEAFSEHLITSGRDRYIMAGVYDIPADVSWEEIIEILAEKKE